MPRCMYDWRRGGTVTIGVTATCDDADQFYSLTYVFHPRPDLEVPLLEGGTFDSEQLRAGVSWQVPEGYRCAFQLVTTGNQAIDTEITLDGTSPDCVPGTHCQGACVPSGTAGLAGYWTLSAVRQPS